MRERQNQNSTISDYFNSNNVSNISKNNGCSITKLSNESNEFKELNKEIFNIIKQGGSVNDTNLSLSSNNNSLPSFKNINWKKNNSCENSSLYDNKKDYYFNDNSSLSNISNIPKKQIETLNMRNTFDDKDEKDNNISDNANQEEIFANEKDNFIWNNNINSDSNENYNDSKNKKEYDDNNFFPCDNMENDNDINTKIPKDSENVIDENLKSNKNDKYNNKYNNDYTNYYINNINNTNYYNKNINKNDKDKNYTSKQNYKMYRNNNNINVNINNNIKNNINNNINNNIYNNINNNNNQINNIKNNPIENNKPSNNSNQNFIYYQTQYNINTITNNYFFSLNPTPYMFPDNAFSYNPTNVSSYNSNPSNSNKNNNNKTNNNNSTNDKNWKETKKSIPKKKFKDKLEHGLFIINLENIIRGLDQRTTVMIRHIPNKYTSQTLLEELDDVCKNRYDFFYLPLDSDNNCNLGYAFINFIDPLHIIHFYHTFKQRKWKFFKSHKECDLTFAKFQGKSELTANLEKNMNKIEDKKKMPMVFDVPNPNKIELEKIYYDAINKYRHELVKDIIWI